MSYILLASAKIDQEATRTFLEYSTKDDLAQTVIRHFEEWLTEKERLEMEKAGLAPSISDCLEYTADQIYEFMDNFYGELVCLVKEEGFTDLWQPMTIDWIKEAIQIFLQTEYRKNQEAATPCAKESIPSTPKTSALTSVMEVE